MIKIGICDDEKYYLNKVRRLAEDNLKALCIQDAEIRCYTSGKEMCLDEQFLEECSILFLDINMRDCNGVEIAYEIKQKYSDILLVFVTAYMDYVLMGYRVEAFRFLLKDNLEEMMGECIPALVGKQQKGNGYVRCVFRNGEKKLRISNIMYIESFQHRIVFHMNDTAETIYEKNGSLSELEKRLECHGFCRIHKSYLVNMMYVDKMECYKVHMENGIELPIPREKYRKVRESYFKVMGEM